MTPRRTKILLFPACETEFSKSETFLFELMPIETQCKKYYFTFFGNIKLELSKESFIWNKKTHVQNQQKIFLKYFYRYLIYQQSHPNGSFFSNISWLFLTLKLATYLKRKLHVFLQHFLQVYLECILNPVEHLRRRFLRK